MIKMHFFFKRYHAQNSFFLDNKNKKRYNVPLKKNKEIYEDKSNTNKQKNNFLYIYNMDILEKNSISILSMCV